jgi:hypothetical protein
LQVAGTRAFTHQAVWGYNQAFTAGEVIITSEFRALMIERYKNELFWLGSIFFYFLYLTVQLRCGREKDFVFCLLLLAFQSILMITNVDSYHTVLCDEVSGEM